jgi:pimeloyl-ACP methyl ester carboxylesterase
MHRFERPLAWVTVAVLAICGIGAMNALAPSNVNDHADAVVQLVQRPPLQAAIAVAPGPALTPTTAPEITGDDTATDDPGTEAGAGDGPTRVARTPPPGLETIAFSASNGPRSFTVTVWYPAEPGAYPLVVLAHGFGASASTYEDMEMQLASAGFVVAAPDFPFTSANSAWLDRSDVVNQAADISALVTGLTTPETVPAALRGRIAGGSVGVIGHSDGGITAAAVAYNSTVADARIGAAVVLSGAEIMYGGSWFTTASPPLLAIHGDADEVNPYWASEQLFADATGPRWLVAVRGGSHAGPFSTGWVEPAVAVLIADFLHAQLQLDPAAAARIDADANADGLRLAGSG